MCVALDAQDTIGRALDEGLDDEYLTRKVR
jgi:hypothetical protein